QPMDQAGTRTYGSSRMTSEYQAGSQDVRELQMALRDAGHDPGEIDGIWGPRTRSALRDFQEAEGLNATGRLDQQTAQALNLDQGMQRGTATADMRRSDMRQGAMS